MGKWKTRKTTEQFIADSVATHGDRYDYSRAEYKTNRTKVEIICKDHGPFWQAPLNHMHGAGCPECSGCRRTTVEDFIKRAKAAHGDRYDYSKIEYRGVDSKVVITCPEHGDFEQIPYDHMKGRGCAKCGAAKAVEARRHSLHDFVTSARLLHGDKYDYSKSVYVSSLTQIEIVCPDHGSFWQVPHDHKTRYGCRACSGLEPIDFETFETRGSFAHQGAYEYDGKTYTGYSGTVGVKCQTHGWFVQRPKDHARGAGCPSCASEKTSSKAERDIGDWLEGLGERVIRNDRTALGGMEIDIYLPDRAVGIEYNGSYWHHDGIMAHPRIHELKLRRAQKSGIRLVTIWDFDWISNPELMQRHMLHAIGAHSGVKINARSCSLSRVTFNQAKPFYAANHLQGAPWRASAHYGLHFDGKLVACMSFGQGSSRRGKTGSHEWELLRFATCGIVRGGASRLFSSFLLEQRPDAVWSFPDSQHFGGGLYPVLGFEKDGHVPADYRVAHPNKRMIWHKSAWKRAHIPARLAEIGIDDPFDPKTDPRTEREMQAIAGAVRIMDSGKIRWKWTKKDAQ